MRSFPTDVTLVEVGPRDGLQNEVAAVPTAAKVAFVEALADAGLRQIEVTAFVHPKRVPQMADASEVLRGLRPRTLARYSALVPNQRGLDRALEAGLTDIAIFGAASESFSQRNLNAGIDKVMREQAAVARRARERGMRVRGYLSTCFGCPFEGQVAPARVTELARRMLDECGVYEVAVSDTIGVAQPGSVSRLLDGLLGQVPVERVALHFHDTRGTALANVLTGLGFGVSTYDTSAGGLGGCPFAPGASGNLATEDLLYMLDGLGIRTGVSLEAVMAASLALEPVIGHSLPSRYVQGVCATSRVPLLGAPSEGGT
jgi:isopropylmalate/homocitrate/citramalate synthase